MRGSVTDRKKRDAAIAKIEDGLRELDTLISEETDEWDREPGEILTKWVAVGLWEKPNMEDPDGDMEQIVVYSNNLGLHARVGLLTLGLEDTRCDFHG